MKTITIDEVAKLLHKTPRTVANDLKRRPNTLPPKLKIPGAKKPLWLEEDVHNWILGCRRPDQKKAVATS